MDVLYVFACGIAWRKYGDHAAHRELMNALYSGDRDAALVAETMLTAALEDMPAELHTISAAQSGGGVSVSIRDLVQFLLAHVNLLRDAA